MSTDGRPNAGITGWMLNQELPAPGMKLLMVETAYALDVMAALGNHEADRLVDAVSEFRAAVEAVAARQLTRPARYHEARERRQSCAVDVGGMSKIEDEDVAGHCYWCGAPSSHRDHVMPVALHGADSERNLVHSCQRCNSRKGGRHPLVWIAQLVSEEL